MFNYELAKELKDRGFRPDIYLYDETREVGNAPTLEELIEACNPFNPDEFVLNTHLDYWEARWDNNSAREEDDKRITTIGINPTEAIARLWLALNEK